ncbi:MAG: hypothetical protein JSW54_03890 [Fidelibacterota bacterium]|nr:MAG: hypothetical protein JSW54_03890 [Candidatus Neomarinimicrobiota bacterium]
MNTFKQIDECVGHGQRDLVRTGFDLILNVHPVRMPRYDESLATIKGDFQNIFTTIDFEKQSSLQVFVGNTHFPNFGIEMAASAAFRLLFSIYIYRWNSRTAKPSTIKRVFIGRLYTWKGI